MNPIEHAANAESAAMHPLAGAGADRPEYWFNVNAAIDYIYERIITHGFHFEAPASESGQPLGTGLTVGELLRVF